MGNDCAVPGMTEGKLIYCYDLAGIQIESKSVATCVLMLQTFGGFEACSILTKELGPMMTLEFSRLLE